MQLRLLRIYYRITIDYADHGMGMACLGCLCDKLPNYRQRTQGPEQLAVGQVQRKSCHGRSPCAMMLSGACREFGAARNERQAERWSRWQRAGLVSLKGGLRRVVIRQLRMLGIVGFPIPRYDAQTGTWQTQKTSG